MSTQNNALVRRVVEEMRIRMMRIDIDCIVGGKVVECWPIVDKLGLLQHVGVISVLEYTGQRRAA